MSSGTGFDRPVRAAAPILAISLVVAAALSQFSAALADTLAASGNLEEVTHRLLKERYGYVLVGGGAIALTWSANTFELVALASRAFAFYLPAAVRRGDQRESFADPARGHGGRRGPARVHCGLRAAGGLTDRFFFALPASTLRS